MAAKRSSRRARRATASVKGKAGLSLDELDQLEAQRENLLLAQAELEESRNQYAELFDRAPVGYLTLTGSGEITRINFAAALLLGVSREHFKGVNVNAFIRGSRELQKLLGHLRRCRAGELNVRTFLNLRSRAGRVIPVELASHAAGGPPPLYPTAIIDLSEHRRAEASARWLVAIVESSGDAIIGEDLHGVVTSWNRGAEALFGYPAAEVIGQTLKITPPREELSILECVRRDERIERYETVRQRKDGSSVEVSLTVSPIKDADGRIVGASKIFRDITERKQAASVVRESEERFVRFMRHLPGLAWIKNRDGQYVYANDAAQKIFGQDAQQLYGKTDPEIFPPETAEQFQRNDRSALDSETGVQAVETLRHPGGEVHYSLVSKFPIRGASGEATHIGGMAIDITERKQAEERLNISLKEVGDLKAALDEHAIVAITDSRGKITYVNDKFCAISKYSREELLGQDHRIVNSGHHPKEFIRGLWTTIMNGRVWRGEIKNKAKDGSFYWVDTTIVPFLDERNQPRQYIAIRADVPGRKLAEEKLKRALDETERASRAKDDFLATLSHELRTPLNPALLLASEAARDLKLPVEIRRTFDTIRKNVELEARLIDDMLDLTRVARGKLALDFRAVDLHAVLQDTLATVWTNAEEKQIALAVDFKAATGVVSGDAVRLQQIFWNVLKNAVKFTPRKGKISVETSAVAGKIVVKVADTGIGLTSEELARAFNAFAQGDHAAGHGAHRFGGIGLGLAITRTLVELHSGTIRAESAGRGCGAAFFIELPLAKKTGEVLDLARGQPALDFSAAVPEQNSRIHILLVEDHEPTRVALAKLLARRHYRVKAAATLAAARALAQAEKFDFVVSDIGLPDGSGCDLMRELRDAQGLKGIALTGYGMEQDIAHSRESGFVAHLTKPVRMESLDNALAAILDAKTDSVP
jgi:PAS domain S-box-containing protein